MHAVGMRSQYISREAVPAEALQRERELLTAQAAASGKPPAVVAKMVEGRLGKYFEEVCLLEQRYLLDDSQKVGRGAMLCSAAQCSAVPGRCLGPGGLEPPVRTGPRASAPASAPALPGAQVAAVVKAAGQAAGSQLRVSGLLRVQVGEGLQAAEAKDFAEEVAQMAGGK
jgi:translation elongation factor EF-Ts